LPLPDPELDLLLEMLAEDPASGPFLQVGEELLRRSRWEEAVEVLWNGLAQQPDRRGWEWLARAALEAGRYDVARAALIEVERDPRLNPEMARVEILVLERSGRLEQARACAERFLSVDPMDVVVTSVIERLDAPPPSSSVRAADPFYTVDRAERYVEIGRADRALRVFRRIQLANPKDTAIELRIRQLLTAPSHIEDDLSAELTDPGLVPPEPDLSDLLHSAAGPPLAKATPSLSSPRLSTPHPSTQHSSTPPPSTQAGRSHRSGPPHSPTRGGSHEDELPTDVPAPTRGRAPESRAPEAQRSPDLPPKLTEALEGEQDPDELPTQRMELSTALKRYADLMEHDDDSTDDPQSPQRGRPTGTR
jgi:tetratricopeptide (TPR) repeat protein